jgi:outer membrane receptor protein involved in Fe transport
MNVGEATFRGLELAVGGVELLGTSVSGQASLISFSADETRDYESKYALRPLTRQLSLEAARPVLAGVSVLARATHARRAGAESFVRVDARLSKDVVAGRVFLDLTNLTDAEYLDVSRMPAPGAAVFIGFDWAWGF